MNPIFKQEWRSLNFIYFLIRPPKTDLYMRVFEQGYKHVYQKKTERIFPEVFFMDHVPIAVGGDDQYALCGMAGQAPSVTLETYPLAPEAHAASGLPAGCRTGLRIDDGMCDALFVMWSPQAEDFIFERN